MRTEITFFLLCLYSTFSFAQEDVFTLIAESDEHSIFTELLEFTGVDELLKDDNYYSVFAPDNTTIMTIYSPEELDSLKLNELETLRNIILHHVVSDTVYIDNATGPFLPLNGNHIYLFVDAAAIVIVAGGSSMGPNPRLMYPSYSEDVYLDADNGRILWLENNLIHPICEPLSEVIFESGNLMFMALDRTGLHDTLNHIEEPLTIIASDHPDTYDYIDDNGGFEMTPFLDSFVRRHIIEGHFPFQKIYDGLTVENWLGETLAFNI